MDVGSVGLWTFQLDLQRPGEAREVAAALDEQGWGALWVPEAVGREALSHAALLLSATERMVVATGVANVWARAPMVTAAAQRLLFEDSGGRFLLGLGVSHQPLVEGFLRLAYEKPLAAMVAYLDAIDNAFSVSPPPEESPPRVLAALGPKMLALAAERAWGAHTYFVPPEHTATAREALGDVPMLMVEQAVVLSTDPTAARDVARRHMQTYLGLPNYTNNLRRLGWADDDLAGEGSDTLVDAIVAWGDVDAVVARVRAHQDAGADHVCLQVLDADFTAVPLAEWEELAAALVPPRES
jgi:probable F420-dependent oxidoreductase